MWINTKKNKEQLLFWNQDNKSAKVIDVWKGSTSWGNDNKWNATINNNFLAQGTTKAKAMKEAKAYMNRFL